MYMFHHFLARLETAEFKSPSLHERSTSSTNALLSIKVNLIFLEASLSRLSLIDSCLSMKKGSVAGYTVIRVKQ